MTALRWVKVATTGRATNSCVPLAMIEDEIPQSRPHFYKLQQKNETTGEWVDVEIEGPK